MNEIGRAELTPTLSHFPASFKMSETPCRGPPIWITLSLRWGLPRKWSSTMRSKAKYWLVRPSGQSHWLFEFPFILLILFFKSRYFCIICQTNGWPQFQLTILWLRHLSCTRTTSHPVSPTYWDLHDQLCPRCGSKLVSRINFKSHFLLEDIDDKISLRETQEKNQLPCWWPVYLDP